MPRGHSFMATADKGIAQRTLGGMVWTLSGTMAQTVVRIGVLAALSRLLSPEDFGIAAIATIVVNFAGILGELGIGPAVIQRAELRPEHVRSGVTVSVLLGGVMTGACWLAAPWIARGFGAPEATDVIRAVGFMFLIRGIAAIARSLAQREFQFRALAIIQVVSYAVGYGAVGITCAVLHLGVWALVAAQLSQTAVEAALYGALHPSAIRPGLDLVALRELAGFGSNLTVAKLANFFALQGDYLVVGYYLGPAALGIYTRAYQLLALPANFFGRAVESVLFPAMAKVQDDKPRLAAAFRRGLFASALLLIPISAILMIFARELIAFVLGDQWDGAIVPFQMMALAMVCRTSYKIGGSLAKATGGVGELAVRQIVYAVAVFGGSLIGQRHGINGVAIAVAAALVLHYLSLSHQGMRASGLSWSAFFRAHLPALALAAVAASSAIGLRYLLRGTVASPAVVFLAGGGGAGALCTALVLWRRGAWLGDDARWWKDLLAGYLRKRKR